MRIVLCAVGRLRQSPEQALVDRYVGRIRGRWTIDIRTIDDRKAPTPQAQEKGLLASIPDRAATLLLDERGQSWSSMQFKDYLVEQERAAGQGVAIVIGGADGVTAGLKAKADSVVSFGPATWPHGFVRVMALEQIYRSLTLLAGHPYHRA